MRRLARSAVIVAAAFWTLSMTPAWTSVHWTGFVPVPGSSAAAITYAAAASPTEPQTPRTYPTPPAGTVITVRMLEPVDSSSGAQGREYLASVTQSMDAGNGVVIPRSAPATVTLVQTADGWVAQLTSVMIVGQKVPVTSVSATLGAGAGAGSTSAVLAKLAGRAASGPHVVLPAGTEVRFVLGDAIAEQAPSPPPASPVTAADHAAPAVPLPPTPVEHAPVAVNGTANSVPRAGAPAAAAAPARAAGHAAATDRPAGATRTATPARPSSGGARAGSSGSSRGPSSTQAKAHAEAERSRAKQTTSVAQAQRTPAAAAAAPVSTASVPSSPETAGRTLRRGDPGKPSASSVPAVTPAPRPATSAAGVFCAANDAAVAYFSAAFASAHRASRDSASFAGFLGRQYQYRGSATCADAEDLAAARRALAARINAARSEGKKVIETGWTGGGGASRALTK
jgi:hypothetical protein